MKIFKDLVQGSDEWCLQRWGKIGGSTANSLMTKLDKPVTECAAFYGVLAERMEDFDPFNQQFKCYSMQRGNEIEPLARKEYERITGFKVDEYGWIELKNGTIGISPDGWMKDQKKSIEIKCPEGQTHAKYMDDFNLFLSDYAWQIVHNFLVIGVESVDCISYRPENKIKPIIIHTVTASTIIEVNKKMILPISDLVEIVRDRLSELEIEINNFLTKQKNQF